MANGTGLGGNTADGGNSSDNDSGYGGADGLGPGGIGMGADADAGIGGYGAANAGQDGPGSGDLGGFEANGYSPSGVANAATAAARAASAFGAANTRTNVRAARANSQDRRDALSNKDSTALSQDISQNLAKAKSREASGYQASSMNDRRGTAMSKGGAAGVGSTRDGINEAASMAARGSMLGRAATVGAGLLGGVPGAAATNATIGAVAANNMNKDVTGNALSAGDMLGYGARAAAPGVAGALGGKVGGLLGASLGPAGAIAGALAGSTLGKQAVENAKASSYGQPGAFEQAPSTTGTTSGLLGAWSSQQAKSPQKTGYGSSFGTYDSHLSNFTSRALDAWA